MIWLTSRPPSVPADGSTFAVVHPDFEDIVPPGLERVGVDDLLADRSRLERGGTMVVVGLSRILTPSNRVRYGQVFLRPRPGLRRVIVDRFLFVGEPWRAFWHMYSVGVPHCGFTDSFLAESRWRDSVAEQTEDPFSADAILSSLGDRVSRLDPPRLPCIDAEFVETTAGTHEDYAAEKERAFAEEVSAEGIIRRLGAFAARAVPQRWVPTPARLFSGAVRHVVASDLPVDRYLVGRLRGVVQTTNRVAGDEP